MPKTGKKGIIGGWAGSGSIEREIAGPSSPDGGNGKTWWALTRGGWGMTTEGGKRKVK